MVNFRLAIVKSFAKTRLRTVWDNLLSFFDDIDDKSWKLLHSARHLKLWQVWTWSHMITTCCFTFYSAIKVYCFKRYKCPLVRYPCGGEPWLRWAVTSLVLLLKKFTRCNLFRMKCFFNFFPRFAVIIRLTI